MSIRSSAARRARVLCVAFLLATAGGGLGANAAGAAAPTMYYVAMGDSLGAGVGASSGASSYVHLVYQHELARFPGLQLENFSCSGATTGSVIHSDACGASVTQLAQAEAFLSAHARQIAFVTIDIGGNDVDGCGTDATCLSNGLAAVSDNIPIIISGLKAADPAVKVFGMTYYDPFLATWLTGADGQTQAQQSVTQADDFNNILASSYAATGVATADVAGAFQTDDFSLTGTYNDQTVPQNVANVCAWTNMCIAGDFHTDDAGHAVLAGSFEQVIDAPTAPDAPSAVTDSPGNGSVTLRWVAPGSNGGSPLTGYVVTPYIGTTAQPARTLTSLATGTVIGGLTNATIYTFRVAARNAIGTGAQSAASAPIAAGAPLGPTAATAAPGNGAALVQWIAPASTNGAPLAGYTISVFRGATLTKSLAIGIVTHAGIPALVNGVTYSFRVVARNARGASHAAQPPAIVIGAPTAPARPAATAGAASVRLAWTAPANNGSAITGYVVTPYLAGVALGARSYPPAATAQTVTGLAAGHTYTFRIAARNGRGLGPASIASTPTTPR